MSENDTSQNAVPNGADLNVLEAVERAKAIAARFSSSAVAGSGGDGGRKRTSGWDEAPAAPFPPQNADDVASSSTSVSSSSLMAAAARAAYAINMKAAAAPPVSNDPASQAKAAAAQIGASMAVDPAAKAKAAAAQIGASLAVQKAQEAAAAGPLSKEIEINNWPSRFELIKRAMNGELFQRSGAVVTCKGRYRAPGDVSGDERPLYLHICADTQDKIDCCVLLVQGSAGSDSVVVCCTFVDYFVRIGSGWMTIGLIRCDID
jgi:hypothetical protein